MKKIKIISIFVFLLLLGCNGTERPLTQEELRVGTSGIEMDFVEQRPPASVLEEDYFDIGAKVNNRGAYAAEVLLTLSVEEDYIELEEIQKDISVKGKSLSAPEGELERVYFNAKSKNVGSQKTRHPTNIILTACYHYKTIFTDQICINPHQNPSDEDVCTDTYKNFKSQGAPLAITKIESKMQRTNDKITPVFIFHVENKGDGTLLSGEAVDKACSDSPLERDDLNFVKLEEVHIGNKAYSKEDMRCDEKVKLIDDRGSFKCELNEAIDENSPAYNSQTTAIFSYGYTKSVSKNVNIERKA